MKYPEKKKKEQHWKRNWNGETKFHVNIVGLNKGNIVHRIRQIPER